MWNPDAPLREGRNAHHSNTAEEMREALKGDYNWLEGDLRLDAQGVPVLSHDADKEASGLKLDEWLAIGAAGERGMKIDVKEREALPKLLDALERSGIPQGRIMINVGDLPDQQVREMRERFPNAWLALNPSSTAAGYSDEALDSIISDAKLAGGRVAFPVRWDLASDRVIQRLEPHGDVSIWTSDTYGTPGNTAAEIDRLRERGVNGVIDLGPPPGLMQRFVQGFMRIWNSDAVRGVRGLFGAGVDLAGRGLDAVRDGAVAVGRGIVDGIGSGVDAARGVAKEIPLIGGLFD